MRAVLVATVVSIASSVGFAAHGIAALVERIATPEVTSLASAPPSPPEEKSAAPIIARNPFDSERPISKDAPVSAPTATTSCDGITVHAIANSNEADWSFASLITSDARVLVRKGARLGNREVAYVGRESVWLEDLQGKLCRVDLHAPAIATTRDTAKPALATKDARAVDPEIARGIRKTSDNSYDIDSATFEKILMSTAELMGDVRVAPDKDGGHVNGMKLARVRPGSVLSLVGLKDGDRLDVINGIELTSPEAGLEAYARLRTAPHIVLRVTRGGHAMELQYDVR